MPGHTIYSTPFASVYPHYVKKAEAKVHGRLQEEISDDLELNYENGVDRCAGGEGV